MNLAALKKHVNKSLFVGAHIYRIQISRVSVKVEFTNFIGN